MQSAQFQLHADIEEKHWWFRARRRILSEIARSLLPASQRNRVLDVGCGTGANIAALSADYECIGLDASSEAVALAKTRYPQTRFVCGAAPGDLGNAAEGIKLVLLSDVLEHVDDDFQFLSTWLSAAAPGTHFLITVPADMSLWSEHDESFGHYRRYDFARLQKTWDGLPVTVRLLAYYNSRLFPLVKAARWLNRLRGHASGAAGTDFKMPPPFINRILENIFAGEAGALRRSMDKNGQVSGKKGVSLIAVLRREPGVIAPRKKPAGLPPDQITAPQGERIHA